MNFTLRVVGYPDLQLNFSRIDPNVAADDLVAMVISKMRRHAQSTRGRLAHIDRLAAVNELIGSCATLFSDSGEERKSIIGMATEGAKSPLRVRMSRRSSMLGAARPRPEPAAPAMESSAADFGGNPDLNASTTTGLVEGYDDRLGRITYNVGQAFGKLHNGRMDGERGWLYFANGRQTVRVVVKLSIPGKKVPRLMTISAIDLIFSSVGDLKLMLADRLGIRVSEMLMMQVGNGSGMNAQDLNETEIAAEDLDSEQRELINESMLFPLLRNDGAAVLYLLRREGLSVEVRTTVSGVISLSRFPTGATVADVLRRLQIQFHIGCEALGPVTEELMPGMALDDAFSPDLQLLDVSSDGIVARFTAFDDFRIGTPAAMGREGSQNFMRSRFAGNASMADPSSMSGFGYETAPSAHGRSALLSQAAQENDSRYTWRTQYEIDGGRPQPLPPQQPQLAGLATHQFQPSDTVLQVAAARTTVHGADAGNGPVLAGLSTAQASPNRDALPASNATLYSCRTVARVDFRVNSGQSSDTQGSHLPAPVEMLLPNNQHYSVQDLLTELKKRGCITVPDGLGPMPSMVHGRQLLSLSTVLHTLVPDRQAASATLLLTCYL